MNIKMYIKEQVVDLFPDEVDGVFLLTYRLSDIRDIDKRNSSYSKTIQVPSSNNNDKLFGNLFAIDSSSSYDLNKKAPVSVEVDGLPVFIGYAKLNKIYTNKQERSSYEITLYAQLDDFMTDLGDTNMSDLDISEYDHDLTKPIITDSWTNIISVNGLSQQLSKGVGYVYPYVNYGFGNSGVNNKSIEFFRPHIYVKDLMDRLFTNYGYTYDSDFLNSDYFRSLIISPNLKGTYNDAEFFENLKADLVGSGPRLQNPTGWVLGPNYTWYTAGEGLDLFVPGYAPTFDFTENKYVAPVKIQAGIDTQFDMQFYYNYPGSDRSVTTGQIIRIGYTIKVDIVKELSNGTTTIIKSTQVSETDREMTITNSITNAPIDDALTDGLITIYCDTVSDQIIEKGAKIYARVSSSALVIAMPNSSTSGVKIMFGLLSSSNMHIKPVNNPLLETNAVNFNKLLPDVKAKDFFMSLVRMFNLYIEPDPVIDKRLLIAPRDSFYKNNIILDWSKKLDRASEIEIIPMSDVQNKNYILSYQDDRDMWNTYYQDQTKRIYGDFIFEVDNDFLKDGASKTDIVFAPTPILLDDANATRPTSTIMSISPNNAGLNYFDGAKPRIMFYNGLKTCDAWTLNSDEFGAQTYSSYPYAGHLDDPIDSTYDLNFYQPQYYFYNRSSAAVQNLYNQFWKGTIDDIYDVDSKLVTGYFDLTATDINKFSFRDLVKLDNQYYYVNQIKDYNPSVNKLTQVELLKAVNPGKIIEWKRSIPTVQLDSSIIKPGWDGKTPTLTPSNPTVGVTLPVRNASMNNLPFTTIGGQTALGYNNSIQTVKPVTVNGQNNIIDAEGVFFGDGNAVYGNEKSYIFGGNDNIISRDAAGSVLIGTNGLDLSDEVEPAIYLTNNVQVLDNGQINVGGNIVIDPTGSITIDGDEVITWVPILYADIMTLIGASNLKPGTFYYVTDKNIILQAKATTLVSPYAIRRLAVPLRQAYTNNTGGGGDFCGIFGQFTGPAATVGRKVVWGGKVWVRTNTGSTVPTNEFTLAPAQWSLDPGGTEFKYYKVGYDLTTDTILYQEDERGNRVYNGTNNRIDNCDWNNYQVSYYNNVLVNNFTAGATDAYFCNNYNQPRIHDNKCTAIYSNTVIGDIMGNIAGTIFSNSGNGQAITFNVECSSINGNTCTGSIIYNYGMQITNNTGTTTVRNNKCGTINTNVNCTIVSNIDTGIIQSNSACTITLNTNLGAISSNNNGSITLNSNYGDISGNTVTAIRKNSNFGTISSNTGNDITFNSNDGDINLNTNITAIFSNKNLGDISSNVDAEIYKNINLGNISSNAVIRITFNLNASDINDNNGTIVISQNQNIGEINNNVTTNNILGCVIFRNQNNGLISFNNLQNALASINIQYNINNGDIGTTGPGLTNRTISVQDTVINK